MFDFEFFNFAQQIQSHRRYLAGVPIAVPYRQSADDHVGVTNSFDLINRRLNKKKIKKKIFKLTLYTS